MCTDQESGDRRQESVFCPCCARVIPKPSQGRDNALTPDSCLLSSERGFSMIELIVFIVIISAALAGILGVMNKVITHSADPLILKQEIAVAESMLEEIELQDFIPVAAHTTVNTANRFSAYHIVADYDGYSTTGIVTTDGTSITSLANYSVYVKVANTALTPMPGAAIPAASSVQITVTVSNSQLSSSDPLSQTQIDGYRTAY